MASDRIDHDLYSLESTLFIPNRRSNFTLHFPFLQSPFPILFTLKMVVKFIENTMTETQI